MKSMMDHLIGEYVKVLIYEKDLFGMYQEYSGGLLGVDEDFIYLGHYTKDMTPVVKHVIAKKLIKRIEKVELKKKTVGVLNETQKQTI